MKQTSRKKVLLSSVAMMMVATVSLGSATYAWFTNTTTAKADNAKVTVAAPSGLKIAAVKAGDAAPDIADYASNFDLTSLAQGSLNPVSGNVQDSKVDFYTASVDADKNVSSIIGSTTDEYIAIDIYGILSASNKGDDGQEATKNVNLASIAQADGATTAGQVVRCAYYANNAKKAYVNFGSADRQVAPLAKSAAVITGLKTNENFVVTEEYIASAYATADVCSDVTSTAVGTVKYGEDNTAGTKIGTVYLWVEGQDELCNNTQIKNGITGATGNISFNFELA